MDEEKRYEVVVAGNIADLVQAVNGLLATALAELVDMVEDNEYFPESALRPFRALLHEWKEAR